jgi:hypothetical protein
MPLMLHGERFTDTNTIHIFEAYKVMPFPAGSFIGIHIFVPRLCPIINGRHLRVPACDSRNDSQFIFDPLGSGA